MEIFWNSWRAFSEIITVPDMAESAGPPRPERIGPYEILEVLDSGGMGVVYRARDPRLSREVALKVIRRANEDDPRWRQRFADEARAAAALNHPNILAVHDVGIDVDSPYIVAELIDGGSLRQELKRGAIRLPRLLDLATQIADGLTAAHHAHLIHRDLKPENLMLTKHGRIKIVDFGLAKAVGPSGDGGATMTVTAPHTIVGTPAYMSPEQARGDAIDFRSDLFSFGAVLYEMVTGRLAFDRPSSIDTLSAILHDEPRPLSELAQQVPLDLQRIVQRCLAKSPDDRYGSTADLLHDLRWLRDDPTQARVTLPADAARRSRLGRLPLGLTAAVVAAVAFGMGWTFKQPDAAPTVTMEFPKWRKLTFEEGYVHSARFGPDSQTILYSASWGGKPFQIYSTSPLSPESRALDLPPAGLLDVSSTGQLAVSVGCVYQIANGGCSGTLGMAPLLGGAPRLLSEGVRWADWGPGDAVAAIVGNHLEYPLGTQISASAQHVRISPDSRRLAWLETNLQGFVLRVREGTTTRTLSEGWSFVSGLSWTADGLALLLSGVSSDNLDDAVTRVALDGSTRVVLRAMGRIRVLDADAQNRLLVDLSNSSTRSWVSNAGAPGDRREISWLGSSVVDALSNDGLTALLTVRGGPTLAAGRVVERYPIYVRPTGGGAATFLGAGYGAALSPDGRWALTATQRDPTFVLYPLGPGPPRTLERGSLNLTNSLRYSSFAGGNRIAFRAQPEGPPPQTFVQSIDGGPPTPVSHEVAAIVSPVAPDGDRYIGQRIDGSLWLASLSAKTSTRLSFTLRPNQFITQWTNDGEQVFVVTNAADRWLVTRTELRTGSARPHAEVVRDPLTTANFTFSFFVSRDGATIAYTDARILSELFLVEGIR